MSRARLALCVAGGLAIAAAWLAWWTPAILLRLAQLASGRARFALVMMVGDVLKATGRREEAAWLYEREAKRCRTRMAALRARQWR